MGKESLFTQLATKRDYELIIMIVKNCKSTNTIDEEDLEMEKAYG